MVVNGGPSVMTRLVVKMQAWSADSWAWSRTRRSTFPGQSMVKEAVVSGWTTCGVRGTRSLWTRVPAMVGGNTTVVIVRTSASSVKVGC